MEEHELIASVLRGNKHAFGTLVDRYARLCFSIAYRICKDEAEAQDIVQDGLIAAYQGLDKFKQDAKFSTWLYKIVLNKALASKKKQLNFEDTVQLPDIEDHDELEQQSMTESMVTKALACLSDKERLVIDLYYYQDQSIREIATILNLSEPNVKVIMHRTRKKMNEQINQKAVNL